MHAVPDIVGGGTGNVAIVVGFIALIGALAGALTSYLVASRGRYVNTITVERSKWIEKLRSNIANYSSAIAHIKLRTSGIGFPDPYEREQRLQEKMEELNLHASLIRLQLNPWGMIDKNILALIDSIVVGRHIDMDLLIRAERLLIDHSQWLLKAEWEKVKYEAGGPIYRLIHSEHEPRRLWKYRAWVAEKGSIDEVVAAFQDERAKG